VDAPSIRTNACRAISRREHEGAVERLVRAVGPQVLRPARAEADKPRQVCVICRYPAGAARLTASGADNAGLREGRSPGAEVGRCRRSRHMPAIHVFSCEPCEHCARRAQTGAGATRSLRRDARGRTGACALPAFKGPHTPPFALLASVGHGREYRSCVQEWCVSVARHARIFSLSLADRHAVCNRDAVAVLLLASWR
jgi:hypothetical protein